jgi:ribosome-binding protein aMBF1 (putative translation factor)
MKQSHLAEIIRISRQSISEIENAHVMPHPSTWKRFADLEAKHNQPRVVLPVHWDWD